jgi:hypothetical protein
MFNVQSCCIFIPQVTTPTTSLIGGCIHSFTNAMNRTDGTVSRMLRAQPWAARYIYTILTYCRPRFLVAPQSR